MNKMVSYLTINIICFNQTDLKSLFYRYNRSILKLIRNSVKINVLTNP